MSNSFYDKENGFYELNMKDFNFLPSYEVYTQRKDAEKELI